MKNVQLITLIIGSILAVFLIKKFIPNMSNLDNFEKVLNEIKRKYGLQIAKRVEQIYRLETANMTSKQFLGTYSAGMMKFGVNFPYGWNTMFNVFWGTNPKYAPTGTKAFIEGKGLAGDGGGSKEFLVFPSLKAAMFTLAEFIKYYNNAGRWYSTDAGRQQAYLNKLNTINTIYV